MDGLQSSESLPSTTHSTAMNMTRSPEERLARRRARRWKRRARIAGPFLGVSILFAALSLSVGLIEYEPTTDTDRLSDRPIHLETNAEREQTGQRVSLTPDSFTSVNSVLPGSVVSGDPSGIDRDLIDLDLRLPPNEEAGTPASPQMIR